MMLRFWFVLFLASLVIFDSVSALGAGAWKRCTAGGWSRAADVSGAGIESLMKGIAATTSWSQLPEAVKQKLHKYADNRLRAFHAFLASARY